MRFIRDLPLLIRALRPAGIPLITALLIVRLADRLVPALTALALAALVGTLSPPATGEMFTAALAPVLLLGLVMLGGHFGEALAAPLEYLAQSRIDGQHRTRLARTVAAQQSIAPLEDPDNQVMLREVRADPESSVESTPGLGAVAALRWLCGLVGAVATCVILAGFAWWLIPIVLVPALLNRYVHHRQMLTGTTYWWGAFRGELHVEVWRRANVSPAEGKDLRVFGLKDWLVARMQDQLGRANQPLWSHIERTIRLRWFSFLLMLAGLVPAYLIVTLGAVAGAATVAVQTAVLSAGWSLYLALGTTPDLHQMTGAGKVLRTSARLRERLAAPGHRPEPSTGEPGTGRHPPLPERVRTVRFEQVSFTYPGTTAPVLDRVDLSIRTDELLAIVGLNGAGKSTLIKLMCGLYQPTSGQITADGVDITALPPEQWRSRLAVVFQDFNRYELSARENVLLGRGGSALDDDAQAAARESGFADVLERLPRGWDTPLSRSRTGGVDLSGGQWQQLALTRALYAVRRSAELLVADEPTAHLDVRTEFALFERLSEQRRDAGTVLISHRLSTVRRADRIVLLDGGRITESGTHDELIALGGLYARMFAIQAERFRTEPSDGDAETTPGAASGAVAAPGSPGGFSDAVEGGHRT